MGRTDIDVPWEKLDKVEELKAAILWVHIYYSGEDIYESLTCFAHPRKKVLPTPSFIE